MREGETRDMGNTGCPGVKNKLHAFNIKLENDKTFETEISYLKACTMQH